MLFCLASGAAFGAMAVFGKLAYGEGATVGTLLTCRFLLAAGLFWAGSALPRARGASVVAALRARASAAGPRALGGAQRRDIVAALALGAGGYALQAGCYFAALQRIDASLLSLLVYTFPALVAVGAFALGRERLDRRRAFALALASGGLVLVVAGAGAGALDPLGAALGLITALLYSGYILVSDGISQRMAPHVLAALVCTGAGLALAIGSTALGELHPGALTLAGWGWIVCLAAVSTVASITLFFAGLKRIGPTRASILSTVEPLVTVLLAFAVFGETLGLIQLTGGALVLSAVVMIQS